jgi:hypothetical protein
LIAHKLPEVDIVHENLTLEGLRLVGCMDASGMGERQEPASRSSSD